MKYEIVRVATFGVMLVYRRCWDEPGLRRYVVFHKETNRALEEFSRKAAAIKWASENRLG